MDNPRLYDLFNRYTAGQLTASEELELAAMVIDPANEKILSELEAKYWEQLKNVSDPLAGSAEQSLLTILPGKVVPMRRKLIRVVAAAAILLLIGLGSYFAFFNKSKQAEIVQTQEQRFKNDVNPGGYKARLTLADGRTIILDSVLAGELATQGGTVVMNKDGQLVYQSGNNNNEVLYNTLSTSKGETYSTVLADGSKVWLNSASSIRFPVAFIGNDRKVEITGEAYFEVAKDAKKPFSVSVNGMEVQVLGTHFNINAYSDEAVMKTTLLEGSVKIAKDGKIQLLTPGEQATVKVNGEFSVLNSVDVDEVMAWKEGLFRFKSADVGAVMRQLARWYDVDIQYEDKMPEGHLSGIVNRNTSLVEVLKMLELNGVKFRVDGKKITVLK